LDHVASIEFRANIFFPGLLLADQAFSFSISAGNKAILMSHDHDDHDHASHANAHAPASFGKAFAIGIALNTGFVALEAAYGFLSNSVALLADAGHNLSDVLGLIVAWTASVLTRRAPTPRFTYGLRGSSILAALFNAMFLLLAVGAIAWEALQRFGAPEPVAGKTVMAVAAIGIAVNGVTAWLFAKGGREDINIRGAFAHMAGVRWRCRRRACDPVDQLALARSSGQPCRQRADCLGHMGAAARIARHVDGRRPQSYRPRRAARMARNPAGRHQRA
jgi:hypothetical protein